MEEQSWVFGSRFGKEEPNLFRIADAPIVRPQAVRRGHSERTGAKQPSRLRIPTRADGVRGFIVAAIEMDL